MREDDPDDERAESDPDHEGTESDPDHEGTESDPDDHTTGEARVERRPPKEVFSLLADFSHDEVSDVSIERFRDGPG